MKRIVQYKWMMLLIGLTAVLFIVVLFWFRPQTLLSPLASTTFTLYSRFLDQYAFSRLRDSPSVPSKIVVGKLIKRGAGFTSYLFTFVSNGKKVSGLLNIPAISGKLPVVVMVRGYVDKEIYYTGLGTQRAGEALASHGYITIAPDFLGYGSSDPESQDVFEARFEKPQTVLDLLASLSTLPQADTTKVGMWGHSNGGQIALSVLEISQKPYPTVLWAPVTQGFPDSVLQYVGDLSDKGTYIQNQLTEFYKHYEDSDYSIDDHWADIHADLQIHQGTGDDAVDPKQTIKVVEELTKEKKRVTFFTYKGENHNFTKGNFDTVMARDLQFYQQYFGR